MNKEIKKNEKEELINFLNDKRFDIIRRQREEELEQEKQRYKNLNGYQKVKKNPI